jgi:hypothetical protein
MTLVGFPAPPVVTPRHTLSLVPSPKMDAPGLVAAECACGGYRSGPSTEHGAYADGRQHVAAAVLNDAADILTAGLAWLYDTVQPDDALCHHLGYAGGTVDRMFSFIPHYRWPIIVMRLPGPRYEGDPPRLINPLVKVDVSVLCAEMRRRGRTIAAKWNGKGTHSVSLALDGEVHPTLRAAVSRYCAGCAVHGNTVFCGREQGCDWYVTGNARLIKPAWSDTILADPHRIGDPS